MNSLPYESTYHPAELTFPKLVLDLATPEGFKADLTTLALYIPRWYTRPKTAILTGLDVE